MYSYNSHQAIEFATLVTLVGREARGQTQAAMIGVAWSVRNRVSRPRYWGHDWMSVMTHPEAYTSMVPPPRDLDPNLTVYPDLSNAKWDLAVEAAELGYWGVGDDPTHGSDHYYDRSLDDNPPYWTQGPGSSHVCDIDALHFWRAN